MILIFFLRVALRRNSVTVVSGLSEKSGHNPVFQSTILQLDVGDVVQLEASDVKIVHSSLAER